MLNLILPDQLTVKKGLFAVLKDSLARMAPDPRVQVILVNPRESCRSRSPRILRNWRIARS